MGPTSSIAALRRKQKAKRSHRRCRRLHLEQLEARSLLAAFTPGNILVYQVGADSPPANLISNGSPVFIKEFTPTGALVQTIAMPTVQDGINRPLVAHGTNPGDGFLTRSADGRYLLLTGYSRSLPPDAGILSTRPANLVNRVVGRIDWLGNVDTHMGLSDFEGGIHTVASTDGSQLWIAGSNGAIKRSTFGFSTSSFVLATGSDEVHQLSIINNQLYASTESRIAAVGTGLPTSLTTLSYPPELAPNNPYGFHYADLSAAVPGLDTLYVASEGSGLQKYSLYDGLWTLTGTIGTAGDKYRGLTATADGTTITLFAIHSGGNASAGGGKLVKIVDNSGYNGILAGTPELLATASNQTAFRGIAFAPYADNNAPVYHTSGNPSLSAITQVAINNPGNTIAELIASGGGDPITDHDAGALEGVAVVATDPTAGEWQYSLDGGVQWHPIGPVSLTSARLLAADAGTRIRLMPNGTFTGVLNDAIRFRAWDQTDGINGEVMNPNPTLGADHAFSLATEGASIEVLAYTNSPPTISPIADQTVVEDGSLAVNFVVSDDADLNSLSLTAISTDEQTLPSSSITFSGTGANRTVQLSPTANQFGDVTITITASDGEETTTESFVLSVTPVNDAPTVSEIADLAIEEDNSLPQVSFTVADVEQAIGLTVTVTSDDPLLFPSDHLVLGGSGGARTLDAQPAVHRYGSATITITVTDSAGSSTSEAFLVTVNPLNDPPTISPIEDALAVEDTQLSEISFQIADPETAAASLVVSVAAEDTDLFPSQNISLEGNGTNRILKITPAANSFGSTRITVTVEDAEGETFSKSFQVTVTAANDDPVISQISDLSAIANASIGPIDFTVSDVDNQPDSLTVVAESSNLSLVPLDRILLGGTGNDRTVLIQPVKNLSGSATIRLIASDGQGGEAIETFQIIVAANEPPTLSEIADQAMSEDQPLSGIAFSIGDLETGISSLQVSVSSSNLSLFPLSGLILTGEVNERTLQLVPAENQSGSALITVNVTDENGAVASRSFSVEVSAVNDAPVAVDDSINTIQDDNVAGNLPATDVDGPALTFTLNSLPRKGIVTITDPAAGTYIYRPYAGEYGPDRFSFQVSDGLAPSNQAKVRLQIAPQPGSAGIVNGVLTVTGTPGDDYILVSRWSETSIVAVVGVNVFGPFPDPNLIRLIGGDGHDHLLVHNLSIPTELHADSDESPSEPPSGSFTSANSTPTPEGESVDDLPQDVPADKTAQRAFLLNVNHLASAGVRLAASPGQSTAPGSTTSGARSITRSIAPLLLPILNGPFRSTAGELSQNDSNSPSTADSSFLSEDLLDLLACERPARHT